MPCMPDRRGAQILVSRSRPRGHHRHVMAKARLVVNIFDGTRQLLKGTKILLRVRDGDQRAVFDGYIKSPTKILDVPFYDNLRDNYTVLASADGFMDAGFFPVKVSSRIVRPVFLMLLPRNSEFNFFEASWMRLKETNRGLCDLFSQGALDDTDACRRYEEVIERKPGGLACLLNILTVMRDVMLPRGQLLGYLRGIVWDDSLMEDRFFAFADPEMLNQVRLAAEQKAFVQEPSPGLLHPGATCSYKQVQFGEANLQLTFHEKAARPKGTDWIRVEPDIDYYKDLAAHALLEVLPNKFNGGTDPKRVYVLRWIAGHHANIPEFNPPYVIRARRPK